jgi:hypothetical protein
MAFSFYFLQLLSQDDKITMGTILVIKYVYIYYVDEIEDIDQKLHISVHPISNDLTSHRYNVYRNI